MNLEYLSLTALELRHATNTPSPSLLHTNRAMAATDGDVPADTLFSTSLISQTVVGALPGGYSIRPLQRGDFGQGFLDVLRVLTHVGDVSQQEFEARFDEMKKGSGYHVLVILDGEQKIVGTGALIVERKLYVPSDMWGDIETYMGDTGADGIGTVYTTSALWDTSKTSRSRKISRARSWGCGSSRHWTMWLRRLGATRRSWTVRRPTRDSMSSAVSSGLGWRWHITMDRCRSRCTEKHTVSPAAD